MPISRVIKQYTHSQEKAKYLTITKFQDQDHTKATLISLSIKILQSILATAQIAQSNLLLIENISQVQVSMMLETTTPLATVSLSTLFLKEKRKMELMILLDRAITSSLRSLLTCQVTARLLKMRTSNGYE
jgi:hypothetical protein